MELTGLTSPSKVTLPVAAFCSTRLCKGDADILLLALFHKLFPNLVVVMYLNKCLRKRPITQPPFFIMVCDSPLESYVI